MKNRKKLWLTMGLALLIAGAVLFGVGFARDGFDELKQQSAVESCTATYGADEVTALRIEAISANVRVEKADGDAVEVTYFEGDREGVEVKLEGGVLTLKERYGYTWRDYVRFVWWSRRDIVVRVPGGLESAEISSSSGDIAMKDVPVKGELRIGSTSGVIQVSGSAGSLNLGTTSGSIEARDMELGGAVAVGTTSGRITLAGIDAEGAMEAYSTSGDIYVSDIAASGLTLGSVSGELQLRGLDLASGEGALSATTTSGGIGLSDVSAAAFSFGTVSGNVTGVLPGSVRDYTISTGTVSGYNSLPTQSYGGEGTIDASTTSGNIKLTFEEE